MVIEKPQIAFVCPPFSASQTPALGISLLKSILLRQGIACDIHYFNLMLVQEIGVRVSDLIAYDLPSKLMLGEWLFAPAAFGENPDADEQYIHEILWGEFKEHFSPYVVSGLLDIRDRLPAFLDACVEKTDWSRYALVGISSSFQQQCASIALAKRIKSRFPETHILFGGANCFGTMGDSLCRLFPFIDYVCTGEGDIAVPALVNALMSGKPVPEIPGIVSRKDREKTQKVNEISRLEKLDTLPYPDYSDYFDIVKSIKEISQEDILILMETSRGCWWGEKSPCTFCGLNALNKVFRCKSPERVLDELLYMCENYGKNIEFTDNIVPPLYFQNLIPKLADQTDIALFWEVRANLTQEQFRLLACAGVRKIQPGIESFSDDILRLMRKGTTHLDNIQILKWGKQFGIQVAYNILWGFPGENPDAYPVMEELIPKIVHLDPPNRYGPVHFDRFSSYWMNPAEHGISSLTPSKAYRYIYHSLTIEDLYEFVYYFDAEYANEPEKYTKKFNDALKEWKSRTDAVLDVFPSRPSIRIFDTRKSGIKEEYILDGLVADLYLQCDSARTIRELSELNHVAEAEIKTILEQYIADDLMIFSRGRYLSLAVIRDH